MLTRCPSCGTTFRLRPEQLGQAQGRVRCGKCSFAFSAVEHRIDSEATDEPIAPTSPEPNNPPPLPASAVQFSAAGQRKRFVAKPDAAGDDIAQTGGPSNDLNFVPDSPDDAFSDAVAGPIGQGDAEATRETPAELPDEPCTGSEPDVVTPAPTLPEQTAEGPNPIEAVPPEECSTEESDAEEASATPGSADDADSVEADVEPQTTSEYLRNGAPVRRWPWIVGTSLLGVALLVQVVFAYRTELAKSHPGWRPALEAACGYVCTVELPRDADRVSIESSELNPEGDKKRLQLVALLKNRAPYPQSYPHLELTLTDVKDQALVRRVFAPGEYLEKEAAPSFGPNAEVAVKLTLEVTDVSASGYRVYLFYP